MSDAAADAKANEIVEQIKAAGAGIKNGDGAAVDALLDQLQGGGMLVQTKSEIKFDDDAEEALSMLANQFPEEYPEDKPPPKPIKQLS